MPEYFVDLTGSDEEPVTAATQAPSSDDLEELVVRRVNRRRLSENDDLVVRQVNRRPTENSDDVVIVSSNVRRRPQTQSPHIPEFPHPGLRDYGAMNPRSSVYPPGYASELGRMARTSQHRPVAPRRHLQPAHEQAIQNRVWLSLTSMFGRAMREEEFDPTFHPGDPHGDIWPSNPSRDAALQQAMFRSMFETTQHEQIDPDKIEKPVMAGTSDGFTRDLSEKCELLCSKCDNLLGEGNDKCALVYFRNCGHVYCGSCVEAIGKLRGKAKKCSATDCQTKKRQRIVFTQVYV